LHLTATRSRLTSTTPAPSHLSTFFLHCSPPHPALPSFPTRRSSDLDDQPHPIAVPFQQVRRQLQRQPGLARAPCARQREEARRLDRKSTRLNSSHRTISYAVFCLKKKNSDDQDPHLHAYAHRHQKRP